jgi:hypothetical protein
MYKQAVILLLMLFTASVSAALPARYMQTIENAAVWAQKCVITATRTVSALVWG